MIYRTEGMAYDHQHYRSYSGGVYQAFPFALCILNRELKIIWFNDHFRRLLPSGDMASCGGMSRTLSFETRYKLQRLISGRLDEDMISVNLAGDVQKNINLQVIDRGYDQNITLIVSEVVTMSARLEESMDSLREKYGLSAAEALIAQLIAEGTTTVKIAEIRQVSIDTVRSQLRQLREKMGAHSSLEIAAKVFRHCLSDFTKDGQ
jgi:DNA-binding CsgD family transcriptional regulator